MPVITLPDGTQKPFDQAVSALEVAQSIGSGLAKATIAARVNGLLVDAAFIIEDDAQLELLTNKDEQALEVLRHSCAHLLAQAVQAVKPGVQVTIGPVIENGFYYDFASEQPFTPEDLQVFEAKMKELAKAKLAVTREVVSREEARSLFASMGEEYKVEIIQDLPADEQLTLYRQGDFVDLCRGPHVPHTGFLQAFKLTKLAGAYWRGDSSNPMLQRVYGTAWHNKKSLQAHLHALEEAQKRDHRLLAKKMDLFHIQEQAPGMIFWHANGWQIICRMRDYIRQLLAQSGYQEINTPQLVDSVLWEQSGHKQKFGDDMFALQLEDREYVIKPMNCPCHVQVYNQGLKSYRDLPLRLAEFGCCHRNEPSGTLHGLMRVRGFVQDDAHVFCTESQIQAEVSDFIDLLHKVYRDFGFTDIIYKLSTRPEQRIGSDEVWDRAENALEQALNSKKVGWDLLPGEGAFYGPKIEFSLRDCLNRVWQCGTIQVDFSMPERLGATYVDEQGEKRPPVMIHRAILGSFERFLAILLEHYAGHLPLWLAPVQLAVLNISDNQADFATELTKKLQKMGFIVKLDLRNEKIGYKIREHTIARVPYLVILGDKEIENNTLSVRLSSGETINTTFDGFAAKLSAEIIGKGE
jgi:threonyl-tRNA synthetase